MVDNNDALIREVNEEMRREQLARLWERYGYYIAGAAVAIVVVIAGAKLWETQRIAAANQAGSEYEQAVDLAKSGKIEDAGKAFDKLAETGPKGYGALSALAHAGTLLKTDKRPEALAVFDKIVADKSTDPLLADFARIQAASLRLGEADFTEMENRLKPLTGEGSSWRYIAGELLGTAALKAGKLDEARATLLPLLAEPGLTQSAKERIDRLMGGIATSELSNAAPAPTTPAAAPAEKAVEPSAAPAASPAKPETPPAAKDSEKPASAP
ncbi:MAG: tetratricopeptide repeat protein [Hyphomicrobium sp.]|jgi:hypothetical protein|uniref:tetratricopeptide repeat protein n=1 Tax=Hyphomicrobium sp. TaxID=82 RepID=UPI0025C20A2D|nr:tetratricopeptide repeat protein [Hyphomicrobium sp.]MBX9863861.1 tetratricopeptide repeat protein [Hyphomicrobium sp.]